MRSEPNYLWILGWIYYYALYALGLLIRGGPFLIVALFVWLCVRIARKPQ